MRIANRGALALVGLLCLGGAGRALAGPPDDGWATDLAKILGVAAVPVEARGPDERGVRSSVGVELPELSARRLQFESASEAGAWVSSGFPPGRSWFLEQREAEVLLLQGGALHDPFRAALLRDAAWGVGAAPPRLVAEARDGVVSVVGRLVAGRESSFLLPGVADGFWVVRLEGLGLEDVDLALVGGAERWDSASPRQQEQLLAPSAAPVVMTVRPGGAGTEETPYALCAFLIPLHELEPAGFAGRLEGGSLPLAVHRVRPGEGWSLVSARAKGPAEQLTAVLCDARLRILERVQARAGAARVVIPPVRGEEEWFVVVGGLAPEAEYDLSCEPLSPRGALGHASHDAGRAGGGAESWQLLRPTRRGIVRVQLDGPDGADLDLSLHGPDGSVRRSGGWDSREEVALNVRPGSEWLVRVSQGARPTAQAAFELETATVETPRLARDGAGGPRTWAVMVGLSSYQDQSLELQHGRGDALGLYLSLLRLGALDPGRSVVLIDERATRSAVVRALSAVAARADADDLFVLHWSGHGAQRVEEPGADADEPDGMDELLSTHDAWGAISDDDLRRELDRIGAGRQLILLDACHSGGFARDLDRPGRFIVCAAQEQQLAAESVVLKAGLLTAVLEEGLLGSADADHDGRITVRELAHGVAEVVPRACLRCFASVPVAARACGVCGLPRAMEPQHPVVLDRWDRDLVLVERYGEE